MRRVRFDFLNLTLVVTLTLAVAACERGDVERTDPDLPEAGALPPGLDPALALSPDPVDRMNFILGMSAEQMPGGDVELRYQLRLLNGDSLSVEFEQHQVGEEWPPASARAVGALSGFQMAVQEGRRVVFQCVDDPCVEFRSDLESLELPRLPDGPDGDWFTALVAELARGDTDLQAAGGEDGINARLKGSPRHYSETVRTWYQVTVTGPWMDIHTWQQTQGFPENELPAVLRAHLPELVPMGSRNFGCSSLEDPCVFQVEASPLDIVFRSPEDAESFVELFNGLVGAG